MSTPDDVFNEATTYLQIYFIGVSGLMVYNMGSGILRAVGNSRYPLYFLTFSAVLNIVLDLVFVIFFGLGVAGVAYATILSQFASAILVIYVLCRVNGPHRIILKDIRPPLGYIEKSPKNRLSLCFSDVTDVILKCFCTILYKLIWFIMYGRLVRIWKNRSVWAAADAKHSYVNNNLCWAEYRCR